LVVEMKHLRGFSKDEEGISGAVTATLVIATLTLVVTGVYTLVVPVWVETAETNHMHKVVNDFTNLKKNIETQVQQGDLPLTMSSIITLKPDATTNWFGVMGATFPGTLTLDPYSERFNLTNYENPYEVYGSCQGAIYFEPKNQQYASGSPMRIIYANGAILKTQTSSGVVVAAPVFNVVDEAGNRTLFFSTIKLYSQPTTITGSKSVTVQTRTLNAMVANYEGGVWDSKVNVTINATSTLGYMKVYKTFYEEKMTELGFVYGTDYLSTSGGDSLQFTVKNVTRVVLYTGVIEASLT
jgi:hypothetical protein